MLRVWMPGKTIYIDAFNTQEGYYSSGYNATLSKNNWSAENFYAALARAIVAHHAYVKREEELEQGSVDIHATD